jgi:hypothetical protein
MTFETDSKGGNALCGVLAASLLAAAALAPDARLV